MVEIERPDSSHSPYAGGDDVLLWNRFWYQDTAALILTVIIAVCGFGMLLLLAVSILAALLSVLGINLPGVDPVVHWLSGGYKGPILAVALAVVGLVSLLALRSRIRNNALLYASAGCPQCNERDIVRVRRNRGDRMVSRLGIPFRRYECRNCPWDGLRIGGPLPNAEIVQETVPADSLLSNDHDRYDQGIQQDEEIVTDEM